MNHSSDLDFFPTALAVFDSEFSLIKCNSNFRAMLGCGGQELLHSTISSQFAAIASLDEELVSQLKCAILSTSAPIEVNLILRTCSGDKISVRGHFMAQNNADKVQIYANFDKIPNDFAKQIIGEEDLIAEIKSPRRFENQNHLTKIMEATNSTLWDYDFKERSLDLQNGFFQLLRVGAPSEMDLIDYLQFIIHPNDEIYMNKALARMVAGEDVHEFTARFRNNDGEWRWLSVSGAIVDRDENGQPLFAHGLVLDITETKRFEGELRDYANILGMISNLTNCASFEVSLYSGAMSWSDDAHRIFEVDKNWAPNSIENFVSRFFPSDAAQGLQQAIDNVLFSRNEFKIDLPIITGEKNHKWIELIGTPKLDDKEVTSLVCAFRDITESVTTKMMLADSIIAAEAASEAKSQFLANMSHEIRTPLNGVLGIAAALGKTNLDESQIEMVNIIINSGKSLSTILNDVLDFSKIEAGQIKIEREPFKVKEVFKTIFALFETNAKAKGLDFSLECNVAPDFALIGDSTRIGQIASNLVSNAIKFTNSGSVQIKVGTETHHDTAKLRFDVFDTGVGFDAQIKAKLFNRFIQADSSTSRKFGGTGLGLSICRSLSDLMAGKLDCISEVNQGSRFWFEVELELAEPQKRIISDEINPLESAVVAKILIAEDNKINQIVISKLLQDFDLEITFANDGIDAIEQFKTKKFDLVFMDTQMPNMDGLEATRLIRHYEKAKSLPKTPIITLSANAMPEQLAASYEAGADDYVAKPIDLKDLLAKLEKWLADSGEPCEEKRA